MTAEQFAQRLEAKRSGSGWMAKCPAHEDRSASLSISQGQKHPVVLKCFADCSAEQIVAAMGLTMADLMPPKSARNGAHKPRVIARYDYTDEAGKVLYRKCRKEPKGFFQERPDPKRPGEWITDLKGIRQVPFHLPDLIKAIAGKRTVFLVEGEKDVLTMERAGFAATSSRWPSNLSAYFKGADIVVIPDNDTAGGKCASDAARSLHAVAASVRVLELQGLPDKGDISDWFTMDHEASELDELSQAAPHWMPDTSSKATPTDVHSIIIGILTTEGKSERQKRAEISAAVLEALQARGKFYFHSERRDFDSAMFFDRERCRLERLRSDAFLAWLSQWLSINRVERLFSFITADIETAALGPDSTGIIPRAFWFATPTAIYLSNGDGKIVRITANGVTTEDNGTDNVLFAAGQCLAPWNLTKPSDPFETCALFRNIETAATHGQELVRVWCLSLPTGPRSKPPLCFAGEVGSGKTQLVKGIMAMFGLPEVVANVEEKTEADFWPTIDGGGVYCLDNADTKTKWLADYVATAATAGCVSRRKLYTNSETVTLRANAWLALTTANPTFANDPGLADRLLVIRMKRRTGNTADAALFDEVKANRDASLSYVADTLQRALADQGPIQTGLNARHPDFSAFALRIGRAIGREAQTITAISSAETDKAEFCLENDAIGSALLEFVRAKGRFEGTAAELRDRLVEFDPDLREKLSVKRLGKRISALWPFIVKALGVAAKGQNRDKIAVYTLAAQESTAGFAGFQTAL